MPAFTWLAIAGLSAVAVLAPMCHLVRPGLWPNHPDYDSVAWSIAYAGRYHEVHGSFPVALDSDRFAGNLQPIFYAPLLFPMLGPVANAIGVAETMSWFAVACWLLQFVLVGCLAGRVMQGRMPLAASGQLNRRQSFPWRPLMVAAMTCWTIYPLTNLYHRGAYAEFVATSLLTSAVAAGGLALLARSPRHGIAMWALCVWCGVLAAGSHSITAIVGGVVAGLLALAALKIGSATSRRRHVGLIAAALISSVVLSPWLYAAAKFGGSSEVARLTGRLVHEPLHDGPLARFSPFPTNETAPDSFPGHHTQINSPMLLLLAWLLVRLAIWRRSARGRDRARLAVNYRHWGPLLRVSGALIAITLIVSTSATVAKLLPSGFSFIQYAYRLNSYTNLAILTATIATLAMLRVRSRWTAAATCRPYPIFGCRTESIVWLIAIVLSAGGMIAKVALATGNLVPSELSDRWQQSPDSLAIAPKRYFVQKNYVSADDTRLLANEPVVSLKRITPIALPIGVGREFGKTQDAIVEQAAHGWVLTNVAASPWNVLWLDGRPIAPEDTRHATKQLAVFVPGGRHTLNYRPTPDPVWTWLNFVSGWGFVVLTVGMIAALITAAVTRRRDRLTRDAGV